MKPRKTPFTPAATRFLLQGPIAFRGGPCRLDRLSAEADAELRKLRQPQEVATAWRRHHRWLRREAERLKVQPAFRGMFFGEVHATRQR